MYKAKNVGWEGGREGRGRGTKGMQQRRTVAADVIVEEIQKDRASYLVSGNCFLK